MSESFWRSLKYFSYYRIAVATVFLVTIVISGGTLNVGSQDPRLFFWIDTIYLLAAIGAWGVVSHWHTAFNLQLTLQVVTDITFLTLLLFASGGANSGMAMMLLVVLVGAGLVGQGRLVMFYAALAALALLLEQSFRVFTYHGEVGDFFRTGLTSIGLFGSAIMARMLARRIVTNEELARRRGIELADQMRISERVINDMQDGVLVVDSTGQILQANPQAAALLSLPAILPMQLEECAPFLAHEFGLRRRRGVESEMMMRLPHSGHTLHVRFLPPGEGGRMLIFLEDIGRLQQEAQQAKLAALGRLTANMAHEIRNPLSAISHAAELLGDEPDGTGTERLVRIIGDNARRLERLVAEVTELGRRDRASPEPVDLCSFMHQLVDEFDLQDAGCARRMAVDLPHGQVVCFDRGHLHRVISNLLGNALRFASGAPGAVRIYGAMSAAVGHYDLHVVDDGPGIGPAERHQVFEPFFTTRPAGTGLGLYIARELCEANGARLSLGENAPGAHFCISFATTCQDPNQERMQT